jgi:hypothetical protein
MVVLFALFVVGRAFGDKEKAKEAGRLFRLKGKSKKDKQKNG